MFKITNVIILAAGRGTRMLDLCDNTPKPLLKVNEKSIIENLIEYFKQKGMHEIYIVVGYLADQFDYLTRKYNVNLIQNNLWEITNNTSSILAAKEVLQNTLIINGDVVINKDCISLMYETSVTYCEINQNLKEWAVHVDETDNIQWFEKNPTNFDGLYQREITVLSESMSTAIKQSLIDADLNEYYELLVLKCAHLYNIDFKPFIVNKNCIYDIDNKNDFINETNLL